MAKKKAAVTKMVKDAKQQPVKDKAKAAEITDTTSPAVCGPVLDETILTHRLMPIDSFTSLTLQAAKLLAQKGRHSCNSWRLDLSGLKTIDIDIARELCQFKGSLELSGLEQVTAEVAESLGRHQDELKLNGLLFLGVTAAAGLSKHCGDLMFGSLCELDDNSAELLAMHSGKLELPKVKSLSAKALLALGRHDGDVILLGLSELSDDAHAAITTSQRLVVRDEVRAQANKKSKEEAVSSSQLDNHQRTKLRKLIASGEAASLSLATELLCSLEANDGDWLLLFSKSRVKALLSSWNTEVWDLLATTTKSLPQTYQLLCDEARDRLNTRSSDSAIHNRYTTFYNDLLLNGSDDSVTLLGQAIETFCSHTKTLTDEAAARLAKFAGDITCEYLEQLDASPGHLLLAAKLGHQKKPSELYLNRLTSLSDSAAESLSKNKGGLSLNGLPSLSDSAAESLSKNKGGLYLNSLTSLSDAAAEYLSKHEGALELCGLISLSDAAAESLSKSKGGLYINSLTSLSDAAAESLSKHEGTLCLDGLISLSDAAAESVSKHQGELSLGSLTSLSDAAAESVSKHQGELEFSGLISLSDAAAKSFSKHQGRLSLTGLTSLSDAAAESLRKREHFLRLSAAVSDRLGLSE